MIKRFERIEGRYIELIYGQERLAYSRSDNADFYDLVEWAERGGYPGSEITFYDFSNGKVYTPFPTRQDTVYSNPVYSEEWYYFLQGDYGVKKIALYRFRPADAVEGVAKNAVATEETTKEAGHSAEYDIETVACFDIEDVSLYNLRITGSPVYVFNQDGAVFNCIYPDRFSITLMPHQSVTFVEKDRVYIEEWIEEGWDDENNCATEDYRFYNKVIVKDFEGNTLSEEVGYLMPAPDGNYWMA